jgi:two-component system, LytTR family, response regulator
MGTAYKCLIVDDEKPAHLVIQSHLSHCPELVYSGSAYNGKEAIKLLLENDYDCLFLDIDMPLINGLEVLQTLSKRPATIITTAHNQFAFEAYQHDAVDYLLKPISLPRFLKSIEKAKYFWLSNSVSLPEKTTILLKIDCENKEINLKNILYFESIGNYVKVFFIDKNKPIVVYETLKNIVDNTPSDRFVQVHKSYIVNAHFIENIGKESVTIGGGISLPLGRKYELLVNRVVNG